MCKNMFSDLYFLSSTVNQHILRETVSQERVKTTSTVYECTKYLIYEKFIRE